VGIQDVSKDMAEYYDLEEGEGVLVVQVFPGDPAEKAGIKTRDIILEINGKKVKNSRSLSRMIADIGVGEKADIKLLRDGNEKTMSVEVSKRDDKRVASATPQKEYEEELGIKVSALTPEIAKQLNMSESDGVIVVEVAPDSKGAEAGVQVGDVVKEINHMPVSSVESFRKAVDRVKKGDAVQMFILRRGRGFLVIKLMK
jgi:serine protease Do